ncbi:MAG TPA: glycosyltransferase [Panacibacter sp.]|nr:glycosyltransferase [Panacibacter sp.]
MIFKFIRYTQPAWQFNIEPELSGSFASCNISEDDFNESGADNRYTTKSAQIADMGYMQWNKGVLLQSTNGEIEKLKRLPEPTLKDEYIFIRKYWGNGWATFALLMRLCTFKNPVTEISNYLKTVNVKRAVRFQEHGIHQQYEDFLSALIGEKPLVAIIIPTLNRYEYLKDVLRDLEKQAYKNFEVIVVDQSDNFNADFYKSFQLNLKVIEQKEKLLWTARNNAVKSTVADYLLFFDDDSRVQPDWITEHLKCLDFFKADISAGVSLAVVGQKISASYHFFRWADQFDSGNAMIHRSVMKKIGLFDEQFNGQRMGDGEFGFRAYTKGIKSISNPKAFRVHLKVGTGGLREMGSWDGFRPKKWFAPKPIPSVIYLYKKYLPAHLYRNALFIGIMLSNIPYKKKGSSGMLLFSMFLTLIKSPVLLIQFARANSIANNMLKNDQGIVLLDV